MTVIQAIEGLLSNNWEPSISGRVHEVPQPEFIKEKANVKESLRTHDAAYVRDGGDEVHTPQAFGWTHENVEYTVTVELRSANRTVNGTSVDGRIRMFGYRNTDSATDSNGLDPLEAERHGGLTGECKRILKANRKGFAEFDIVAGELRVLDQSDLGGKKYYRADVQIPLTNVADSIDTSV